MLLVGQSPQEDIRKTASEPSVKLWGFAPQEDTRKTASEPSVKCGALPHKKTPVKQ